MKTATEKNLSTCRPGKLARLRTALLVPACGLFLNLATSAGAAVIDLWTNVSDSTGALQLQNFRYDTATGSFDFNQAVNASSTYNIHTSAEMSAVKVSGDGRYLTMMAQSRKAMVTYDLTTGTFNKTANVTAGTNGRNIWSADGQSYYIVGTSAAGSPGYVAPGSTSVVQLASDTTYSMLDISAHNNNLYFSRGNAIYKYPVEGLPTTAATTTIGTSRQLTGDGWATSGVTYNGFTFLGEQILFALNTTNGQIEAYFNDNLALPNDNWNQVDTVNTSLGSLGSAPLQMSLYDNGDGSAQIFFTSGNVLGTVGWVFDEIAGTWGFGELTHLSTPGSGMTFHGVAVTAVPEPGTWMLLGLGVLVLVIYRVRQRTKSC